MYIFAVVMQMWYFKLKGKNSALYSYTIFLAFYMKLPQILPIIFENSLIAIGSLFEVVSQIYV